MLCCCSCSLHLAKLPAPTPSRTSRTSDSTGCLQPGEQAKISQAGFSLRRTSKAIYPSQCRLLHHSQPWQTLQLCSGDTNFQRCPAAALGCCGTHADTTEGFSPEHPILAPDIPAQPFTDLSLISLSSTQVWKYPSVIGQIFLFLPTLSSSSSSSYFVHVCWC